MIAQLTMHTANSVELLMRLPLADLFDLFEAVAFELEQMRIAREEARDRG